MLDLNYFDGLTKVYHDAGEREIRAVVLYAKTNKLYVDSTTKTEVSHDLALELCQKGFLQIFDTDTYYNVVSFKEASGTLTVTYGSGSSPKTATVSAPSL